jgi:hypothetical protein
VPSLHARFRLHPHAAVAQQSQPVLTQRRAEEIAAAQLLPTCPVVSPHPDVGVEAEALDVRLAWPGISHGGAQIPESAPVPRPADPGPRAPARKHPLSRPAPGTSRQVSRRAQSPRPLAPGRGAAGAALRAAESCRGPAPSLRRWAGSLDGT